MIPSRTTVFVEWSLGRTILLSKEFARHYGPDVQAIGRFVVVGFAEEQCAFGLSDEVDKVEMAM
jgi:hypothetical protein